MRIDRTGAEMRRYRNTLVTTGMGMMLFGAWSMIKGLITVFLNTDIEEQLGTEVDPGYMWLATAVVVVIVAGVLLVDLLLRIYIGRAAMAEGKGADKSWAYVVCAGIVLAGTLLSVVVYFIPSLSPNVAIDQKIVGLIVELSSAQMSLELILSAIRVKRGAKEVRDAA